MAKSAWFQKIQFLPLYPFFFIAYPVLALVGININEVEPNVLWRPLFILLFSTLILMLVLRFIMRDWHRAAVLISILIFSYGHAYSYLKKIDISGFILGRHRQMLPVWLGLAALAGWWVLRKLNNPRSFAPTLNLVSIFLLIYPSFQTISYVIKREQAE